MWFSQIDVKDAKNNRIIKIEQMRRRRNNG